MMMLNSNLAQYITHHSKCNISPPQSQKSQSLPTCHDVPTKTKSLVISTIDVPHKLVHIFIIASGRQFNGLFESLASSEEARQAQEGSTSKTGARNSAVVVWTIHCKDAHPRAYVHHLQYISTILWFWSLELYCFNDSYFQNL